ncbi:MAG: hypothetical protein U5K74_11990 [Gemmatimonadaceae bacterium]|nr:hypothetical protein [Gemmatimonadaceae bacterium]
MLAVTVLGIQRSRDRDAASVLRGGPAVVTLLEPGEGQRATGNVTFVWRHIDGASYELEVYSAEGAAIAQRSTVDTTITLRSGTVVAGDYRWWVTAQLEDGTQLRSPARRLDLR